MTSTKRIDDSLSTREGRLFIEECDTLDLVDRFGSPIFVMSEDQIRRNVRRFQSAFQEGWPEGPVKVMPAAKANWISAVQYILADEGCGYSKDHDHRPGRNMKIGHQVRTGFAHTLFTTCLARSSCP